ncbi:hypothetical protein INT47_006703, partial [Mucor saturninus]
MNAYHFGTSLNKEHNKMKSPPPPPPPITNCIPMRTDKRGIPIVQTSPLRTRRHLEREC